MAEGNSTTIIEGEGQEVQHGGQLSSFTKGEEVSLVKHYLMDLDFFTKIGLAPVYALELKNFPGWLSGALMVAEEETWDGIKEGALVAYRGHQDEIHVGSISFTKNKVIFHSLFPGIPNKVLLRKEIKRCDWIRTIDFRDGALERQKAELERSLRNFLGDFYPSQ